MPRTTLTQTSILGPFPSLPVGANGLDVVMTAADVTNKNQVALSGPVILLALNTDTVARTITLTSAPDTHKRMGDVTNYSLDAGDLAAFRIDQTDGWMQTDGMLYCEANNAAVKFGVIRL